MPLENPSGAVYGAIVIGALLAAESGQETAVDWALWSVVASLIAFEAIAGLRSRAAPAELAVEVAVGATMGLAILALKIILH